MARAIALLVAIAAAWASWLAIHYGMSRVNSPAIANLLFWLSPWTFIGWLFAIALVVAYYKVGMRLWARIRQANKVNA
jgi:hypothetical protein